MNVKNRRLLFVVAWGALSSPAAILGACQSKEASADGIGGSAAGSAGSSGDTSGGASANGDGGNPANAGGQANAGGSTSGPPAYFPCPSLEPSYDGRNCAEGCESVSCECAEDFPLSVSVCHSTLGCLTGLDCAAACDQKLSRIIECAQGEGACLDDEECAGYCVGSSSSEVGVCSPGAIGDPCRDKSDCAGDSCRDELCTGDAPLESACTSGLMCASLHCFEEQCVAGEPGQACTEDEHCAAFCAGGSCSEGETGQSCGGPDDCETGICARGEFTHPVCSGGAVGESCSIDADCDSGYCRSAADNCGGGAGSVCIAGDHGDRCCGDENCQSGACIRSNSSGTPVTRECSEGHLGQLCNDDGDAPCSEGYCVRDVCEQTAPSRCLEGTENTRCCNDADCSSGSCTRVDPFDSTTWLCQTP